MSHELSRRNMLKGAATATALAGLGTAVASTASASGTGATVIGNAMYYCNRRYVLGQQGPNAFDCAGLIRYSYHNVTGIWLPVGTYSQFKTRHIGVGGGYSLGSVFRHVQYGDPIFFYSRSHGVAHVGLYGGDNDLLSASSTAGRVCFKPISYFGSSYSTAYAGYWS